MPSKVPQLVHPHHDYDNGSRPEGSSLLDLLPVPAHLVRYARESELAIAAKSPERLHAIASKLEAELSDRDLPISRATCISDLVDLDAPGPLRKLDNAIDRALGGGLTLADLAEIIRTEPNVLATLPDTGTISWLCLLHAIIRRLPQ